MKRRRPDGTSSSADRGHHRSSIYYRNPPDFAELARLYPDFAKHVQWTASRPVAFLDWNDPDALLALTTTLLQHDFGLKFAMPREHLCPPVPQRLNYILWVEDLLALLPNPSPHRIVGVDIGTGASAIFALLGSTRSMTFLCTEIDPESVRSARANITSNALQEQIEVIQVDDPSRILIGVIPDGRQFDFCVCNPPFFDSLDETGLNSKRVCLATSSELICAGGEFQFVLQLLNESATQFRHRIGWFTTMLGKKATLSKLLPLVHATGPACVRTTTFQQGRQARWGLAWTYRNDLDRNAMTPTVPRPVSAPLSLQYGFGAGCNTLETIPKLVGEWARSRGGRITSKSPLALLVDMPFGSLDNGIRLKLSLTPMQSNDVRVAVKVQIAEPDQHADAINDIRMDLQRILQ